jgi:hypothetical protein
LELSRYQDIAKNNKKIAYQKFAKATKEATKKYEKSLADDEDALLGMFWKLKDAEVGFHFQIPRCMLVLRMMDTG